MKTGLLLLSAAVLCVLSTGCGSINMARRGGHSCTSCGKAGCSDVACTGVLSSGAPGAGVSAMPGDPGTGGYDRYGGRGRRGHFGRGRGGMGMDGMEGAYGGPPSAHVAYPYYTTRGPRDFLINNPPSIGY